MRTEITVVTYQLHDLLEYINWIYFFMRGDFSLVLQPLPIFMDVMSAGQVG